MTGALDPLPATTDQLHAGLHGPASAAQAGEVAAVRVGVDGTLESITLTEAGRRLDPDALVDAIVRLHVAAMAQSRRAVADAVARLEQDPRLLAVRERYVDALQQPHPAAEPPGQSQPVPHQQPQHTEQQVGWGTSYREPTDEDDEADDEYFQRDTWLEY
ncbi:hypothetical protein ACFVVM_07555 [Nocardia sp. NPDC058176]|uniref:hypothetical protein n=1 Tax=Nocardia sp. NPDC058176 TaxID=3346368 RepID=UPI0036D8492D